MQSAAPYRSLVARSRIPMQWAIYFWTVLGLQRRSESAEQGGVSPFGRRTRDHSESVSQFLQHNPLFQHVFVHFELHLALERGYRILAVYETWNWEPHRWSQWQRGDPLDTGMMSEFIGVLYKNKLAASGYPQGVETAEQKQQYIDEIERIDGLRLDADTIQDNPGYKSVAKTLINSFWGKTGMSRRVASRR
jgi:hypothetical protein